jgi:hypothetical protein
MGLSSRFFTVEVSNKKKESQGIWDVTVGFMGWTSAPGTLAEIG